MDDANADAPPLILPTGTQVVTRVEAKGGDGRPVRAKGAVGVIVKAPGDHLHRYRVRFPDGREAGLARGEFSVHRRLHDDIVADIAHDALGEYDLHRHVIYRCVMGSRAFGLATEDSDEDRRGIYLPPAALHWSLFPLPEQLERPETEECYWELQKFLTLALKGNPNILECLYTPLVEYASDTARELLAMRACFLSKIIYQSYNGYALSQFRKLEQDLRARGEVRWKHVMHLLRLLLCGIHALNEGEIRVDMGEYREPLLAVRRGERSWEDVDAWRLQLHEEFDVAHERTVLPERPDYRAANDFLVRARRSVT